jgi:hypothetical protein
MLYRRTYAGEIQWGKLQKVTKRGTKHQRHRPESEWLMVAVPDLRIISDDLWRRVHARLAERLSVLPKARPNRRCPTGSRYLLVGFATCSQCGGPIGSELRAHGSTGQRRHVAHYACLEHKRRGSTICANAVGLRQAILDRSVLNAVVDTLHPRVLAAVVEKALTLLIDMDGHYVARRAKLDRDLGEVQRRIDRLVAALADAAMPADEIRPRLTAEKAQKLALQEERAQLDRVGLQPVDVTAIRRQLQTLAADMGAVLGGDIASARQALRALLEGKIYEAAQSLGVARSSTTSRSSGASRAVASRRSAPIVGFCLPCSRPLM